MMACNAFVLAFHGRGLIPYLIVHWEKLVFPAGCRVSVGLILKEPRASIDQGCEVDSASHIRQDEDREMFQFRCADEHKVTLPGTNTEVDGTTCL